MNAISRRSRVRTIGVALQTAGIVALMLLAFEASAESPHILNQPRSTKIRVGETLSLSVDATGTEPLNYTWYHERTEVASGPEHTLSITSAQATDAGVYWVKVSNSDGDIGSDGVLVRVGTYAVWTAAMGGNDHGYEIVQIGDHENDWAQMFRDTYSSGGYMVSYHSLAEENFANSLVPPSQLTRLIGLIQPINSSEPGGGWRWMSGEPFNYSRWNANEPNDGGNGLNPRGHENLVGVFDTGLWNDIHGGARSYVLEYPTQLVLYEAPTNTLVAGYQTAALRAGAASSSSITYTWYLNNTAIPNVTGNVLPTEAVLPDGGQVYVEANDGFSSAASSPVQVTVAPIFNQSPHNEVVYQGDPADFNVGVTGSGPFTYLWYRDGNFVFNGGSDPNLHLDAVTSNDAGSYQVEVFNAKGSAMSAPANLVVMSPNSRLIRAEDFEAGAQPGWSTPVTTTAPAGGRRFLGDFGNETVSLNLTNLPPHTELTVSFDLIVRGYWEGNASSAFWGVALDGSPLLQTTFSSYTSQSYPDQYFQGAHPAATGAAERNTLGYELVYSQISMYEDSLYRITITAPHSATQAILGFVSDYSDTSESGWSIDNLVVTSSTPNGSRLLVEPQAGTTKLNLRVQSQPGVNVTVRQTTDFSTWSPLQSVFNQTGETTIEVDPSQLGPHTFFRSEGN
ncbi:hypothetical protein GC207_08420 [bacterium]|nr:hypothetical protein [bacterium]